jgi:ElaB/YqjD/DUF883 family membrane-anchored ribosome-binding protein
MMERTAVHGAALARELRVVMRQAEELINALGEDRDEALIQIRNRVAAAIATAKLRLEDADSRARQIRQRARMAAEIYARDNPWTAVSIAAALGLILGAWLVPERDKTVGA